METNKNNILFGVMNFVKENGLWGTIKTIIGSLGICILIAALSVSLYIWNKPEVIFERYDSYAQNRHKVSTEYRLKSSPLIRSYLNQLVAETNADRSFILEYHNGKSNPSGLQWQYADMTFINDNAMDLIDEYQNLSLVKYPIAYELNEKGILFGTIEEIDKIDHRIALRLEVNDVKYIGLALLYDSNLTEIGIIGLTYVDDNTKVDEVVITRALRKYAASVAPLLDNSNAMKKMK